MALSSIKYQNKIDNICNKLEQQKKNRRFVSNLDTNYNKWSYSEKQQWAKHRDEKIE